MNDKIEIEWLGDEVRELPGIGVAQKGGRFTVSRNKGESFIKQKLAKATSATVAKAITEALAKEDADIKDIPKVASTSIKKEGK